MDAAMMLETLLPLLITSAFVVAGLFSLQFWLARHPPKNPEARLPRQLLLVLAYVFGLLLITISLPVSEATRGQLLSLAGLVLTALIALSSTTLVANAMAGLLLRIVNSFRPGDFIRVGEAFGRVTERSLFHTEIQTEDRDLMTLPNMHLITNPVTVVHNEGTIISANLSLGYELHHRRIEALLAEAATAADLQDPFVQIVELGDFSVSYRVGGRLEKVASLITARSRLRAEILDALHGQDIEIVSPSFMVQRPQAEEQATVPKDWHPPPPEEPGNASVEEIVFDKAEQAGQEQARRDRIEAIKAELAAADKTLEPDRREALERELAALEATEPADAPQISA